MPTLSDHAKWLSKILAKSTTRKDKKMEAQDAGECKATEATPTSSSPPSKLSLSKSFKSNLTTQVNLSNAEAEYIIARVMARSKGGSQDASLKY